MGELEATMSSAERAEWAAYYRIKGDDRRDSELRRGLEAQARAGLDGLRKRRN